MAAITREAAGLLSQQCATDTESVGMLLLALRRSLAGEAVGEDLYDDLEAVLGEYAAPAPERIEDLAARFRTAVTRLVEIVPFLVRPYPVTEMRRLIDLSAEHPHPREARGHVVRLGMALLALLDLMGDAAP